MSYDKYRPLRARRVMKQGKDIAASLTSPLKRNTTSPQGNTLPRPARHYRNPLYRAEMEVYKRLGPQYILWTLEEAQTYAQGVVTGATVYSRRTWHMTVKQTLDGTPSYQSGLILVPLPVQQMVLLHEIAHHLVGIEAQHGQHFIDAYVYLLDKEMPGTSEKLLAKLPLTM